MSTAKDSIFFYTAKGGTAIDRTLLINVYTGDILFEQPGGHDAPVIIEDNVFIGSRCIVVEGIRVGKEAVLGANVVLTSSSKIIDVTEAEPKEYKGYIPERSVVIPGTMPNSNRYIVFS
jgi:tetrahydrodipicolinate N-succinyltransferase